MSAAPSAPAQSKRGSKPSPSGRLLLRIPASLHAELAQWAEREGVSLNQFITRALQSRIGQGADGEPGVPPAASPAEARSRLIAVALVANAIVIGLAAAAAIGVLVLAWRG
jgi:hypothetical protein